METNPPEARARCMGMSEFYGETDGAESIRDYRRFSPRFRGESFDKNLKLVKKKQEHLLRRECTPSQLALAWVLAQEIFSCAGYEKGKIP